MLPCSMMLDACELLGGISCVCGLGFICVRGLLGWAGRMLGWQQQQQHGCASCTLQWEALHSDVLVTQHCTVRYMLLWTCDHLGWRYQMHCQP